jgi:spore germination protein YaaH
MPVPLLGKYIDNSAPVSPRWPRGEKINMMWEQAYNADAVALKMENPFPAGLNVISPTWFSIDGETTDGQTISEKILNGETVHEGTVNAETLNVASLASEAYVKWADNQGVKIWAMFSDTNSPYEATHALLTDAAARKRVAAQLADYAKQFGVNGLNIDLEHVREADGGYYIQFLRELRAALGDTLLSVDVYVPSAWSEYYRRGDIALTADFVCVMTYDEHVKSSPTSGPVASLSFVRGGVTEMLKEVPKEQLLMGLPMYNRVWRELTNNDSPETREIFNYSMEYPVSLLIENGVTEPEWLAEIGSYYGEYAKVENEQAVLYRVWVEDANSIREKLKIFTEYDLAGVASWARGFENNAVLELLRESTD